MEGLEIILQNFPMNRPYCNLKAYFGAYKDYQYFWVLTIFILTNN